MHPLPPLFCKGKKEKNVINENVKCIMLKPFVLTKNSNCLAETPHSFQSMLAATRHLVIFDSISCSLPFNEVAQQAKEGQLPSPGVQTTSESEQAEQRWYCITNTVYK